MATLTKRRKAAREKLKAGSVYSVDDALALVKEFASAKFPESVDVSINLGVDPRKSDQVVRGSTVLPNGTGKTVRVAVFTQGENAEKAKAAGADIVGFEDLAEKVKGGEMNFDVVIATPDAMRVVGQLGQILGPRGLMPNPKLGTVTTDVAGAIKAVKGGQVEFRVEKAGIVHAGVGKISFEPQKLTENIQTFIDHIRSVKPAAHAGETYELGGPEILTMMEINRFVLDAIGRPGKPAVAVPDIVARTMARLGFLGGRADLERPDADTRVFRHQFDCMIDVPRFEDQDAADLFLGLGVRSIGHHHFPSLEAQCFGAARGL